MSRCQYHGQMGHGFWNTATKWLRPIKTLYGKDWTTDPAAQKDAFGQEVPNAGWLWVKKDGSKSSRRCR